MILTVTLNFALDVTYEVDHFERGQTTRVPVHWRRAGGKGVNVARVLHALGQEVAVTGLAGGPIGAVARAELRGAGLRDELVAVRDESRLTLMVAEQDGKATGFSEAGPAVTDKEWRVFVERYTDLARQSRAVVLSGSLPKGAPTDAYAQLVAAAQAPVLLDADGEALLLAVAQEPDLVKINAAELHGAMGARDLLTGARELCRRGAREAIISDGPNGLLGVSGRQALRAAPPEPLVGNPTGAGDAAAAALVLGLLEGLDWPARLVDAAALSAAAVNAPLAGSFDPELYRRLREQIRAQPL